MAVRMVRGPVVGQYGIETWRREPESKAVYRAIHLPSGTSLYDTGKLAWARAIVTLFHDSAPEALASLTIHAPELSSGPNPNRFNADISLLQRIRDAFNRVRHFMPPGHPVFTTAAEAGDVVRFEAKS